MNRFLEETACDLKEYSPLTLAFIGDGVFELFVREQLVLAGNCPVNKLHQRSTGQVCATAQAAAVVRLEPLLTEEEREVLRRGRNARVGHVPKSCSTAEYHTATALETLFGYLYLQGKSERLRALFQIISEGFAAVEAK